MPKISILVFLIAFHIKLGIITDNIIYSNITNSLLCDAAASQPALLITDSIIINKDLTIILKNLLLISSLFSLLIGTISGLYQTKIKRLFAYSSISHLGFILLALSLNSEQSIESVIFYIIQYSITNLNIFIIIISLGLFIYPYYYYLYNFEGGFAGAEGAFAAGGAERPFEINLISQFKGIFFCNPIISFCLTISLFSMAGIPPLLGFFAKQFVLSSSLENGYYFMSLLGIIVSIISACYYLKIIKLLHTENIEYSYGGPRSGAPRPLSSHHLIPNTHSFIISTLTLIILLFVFKPSILLNISTIISLSLFYC
jgi:NADH-ubiquinone oxidoreductase chain 2